MKILIFFFLITGLYSEILTTTKPTKYIDFGVHGKEYEIKEGNFYDEILREARNFKVDKNEIKKTIYSEVNKLATFRPQSISFCQADEVQDWELNMYQFEIPYFNPNGRLIYDVGDKIQSPLVPNEEHLCFIDAKIMATVKNQINFFKNKYPKCTFLFSNINVLGLRMVYPDLEIYPLNNLMIKRFNLKCSTALISLKDDKIRKEYFSLERFK